MDSPADSAPSASPIAASSAATRADASTGVGQREATFPVDVRSARMRATGVMLNIGHALDHMFLLIFATAVGAIARDFGLARWEDLMPYGVGAFALFGLGSLPSGRLGDLWGRRRMMIVFYFGMGASAMLAALTHNAWQLAAALALLGAFSSIYHPVGIPMLVQHARRAGIVIGINGLAGNLGVALAAVVTGLLVQYAGWRAAFVLPGIVAMLLGVLFARIAPDEPVPPAKRKVTQLAQPLGGFAKLFAVMTVASVSASLLFNFTTNGNGELLRERLHGLVEDPARIGALLAVAYVLGSFAQVGVGMLLDRVPLKLLYAGIVVVQIPLFALAAETQGWAFYAVMVGFMIVVFGAIPFTDALIVRYVDDTSRSRVSGMRFTVAFGVSSLAVWLLGPVVKVAGFRSLLWIMAATATVTLCAVLLLPRGATRGERVSPPVAPPRSPRAAD
jgi:MFS family permease